jgi:2-succinyl-5-enolpyruvyl-6-hydroxy-3-cyclohexene-1-carboxylate synthase
VTDAAAPRPVDRLVDLGTGELNATFCATLVDEWVRGGVGHVVVCPGSRSTPLAMAVVADGRLEVHVHHDERSGAFMALGLGRATGRPAVVVTTSGTAAAEVHPAVVEADLDRVPLLVATADRPPELRHVGAAQTIDQTHLFGRSVRWFADPGPPDVSAVSSWRSLGARAVVEATGSPPGPVHLNLPFREPLVGRPGERPEGRGGDVAWHRRVGAPAVDDTAVEALCDLVAGRRGVIVAGGGLDDPAAVLELGDTLGWPVLADPRSGCRTGHRVAIAHADAVLRADTSLRRPEVVLRLGSVPASKVQARWMADLDVPQVLATRDGSWLDPDRTAALVVAAEPAQLARRLSAAAPATVDRSWMHGWRAADDAVEAVLVGEVDRGGPATEPGAARAVAAAVPDGGALVVSSSMPVRDVEWFAGPLPGIRVHVNRGANGIDGVVSTAVGVASSGVPTALLIGDVAFLHDTNGLLGLAGRDVDLCLVVIDNDGGGIFSFLPQAGVLDTESFEQLFGTPHGVDVAALASAHGIAHHLVEDAAELGPAVTDALKEGGVRLVRIRTDRTANVALHERLHRLTTRAVEDTIVRGG